MIDPKNVHARIDMSRAENIALVRRLFSMKECTFLVMGACQVIAQQANGYAKSGLPPGMSQEEWDAAEQASYHSLGKLWVALPEGMQKAMAEQILDVFKIQLQVETVTEGDCEAVEPATPPPGETI